MKTLPRAIYDIVRWGKAAHGLTNWQTVILALLALKRLAEENPDKMRQVSAWAKETYPDGRSEGTKDSPW